MPDKAWAERPTAKAAFRDLSTSSSVFSRSHVPGLFLVTSALINIGIGYSKFPPDRDREDVSQWLGHDVEVIT
jgi:hypothetical protein